MIILKEVRTRFAPSPTGYMHVGNLRTALYEYLIAKQNNGKFIVRIEDTDKERYVEGATEIIYDTLKLCAFKIDESPIHGGEYGPYTQSERLEIYKEYANKLVEKNLAYYCFCSEGRLEELRKEAEDKKIAFLYDGYCKKQSKDEIKIRINNGEKYVIRQSIPKVGKTTYVDLVYGKLSFENKLLEDQILIKSDGYPTYNFANVVDDHLMNITHVIRGNEYLSSTPKYVLLYEAFGWDIPIYVHVPQVMKDEYNKLSKRNGDASFQDLLKKGYLAEAIINYMALVGWSPETEQEIYSLEELIKVFNVKRINKSSAIFDIKKLQWVNSHYLKKLSVEEIYNITVPFLKEFYNIDDKSNEWLTELISTFKEQLSCGIEIVELTKLFFESGVELNHEKQVILSSEDSKLILKTLKEEISNIIEWSNDNIIIAINNVKDKTNIKGKLLFMPIRIAVSGQEHGPELPKVIYLLGKELVLKRLAF